MKKIYFIFNAIFLSILSLSCNEQRINIQNIDKGLKSPVVKNEIKGTIINVHDGDSLTIIDDNDLKYKIRLYGIDAPELQQKFGTESKAELSKYLNKKITVIKIGKKDRYDRIIGKIYFENIYINMFLVDNGMAWWYIKFAKKDVDLKEAELKAKKNNLGLWQNEDSTPPWEWRKLKKKHKKNIT